MMTIESLIENLNKHGRVQINALRWTLVDDHVKLYYNNMVSYLRLFERSVCEDDLDRCFATIMDKTIKELNVYKEHLCVVNYINFDEIRMFPVAPNIRFLMEYEKERK